MKKLLIILISFSQASNMPAQQRPGSGAWLAVQAPVNFSGHWQWHNDAGYRTLGTSAQPLQYLYRTGIRYHFNKQWNTAGGIAFFFTKTDFDKTHHEYGSEFRFWEEVVHQKPLNKNLHLLIRFRTDQRFFAATSSREGFRAIRFRLRTGFSQKLNDKWSIQLADEYMQQAANHKFSIDQNRVIFSVIHQFNKSSQLQTSYIWLKWPDDNQHILSITYTKTISFHGGSNNNK